MTRMTRIFANRPAFYPKKCLGYLPHFAARSIAVFNAFALILRPVTHNSNYPKINPGTMPHKPLFSPLFGVSNIERLYTT